MNKSFHKNLFSVAIPIILQNLISTSLSSVDTFMLGFIGQNHLSAVSLANQPQFVLSLFFMGITIGTGIMMAQYLGKRDENSVHEIFSVALACALSVSSIFALIVMLWPHQIMQIFTNNAELIAIGGTYLRTIGLSYVLSAFSQIYLVTLKTRQKTKKSALISICALVINVGLNALFIFGLFGAPKLGVMGVAIATVIARFTEAGICVIDMKITKSVIKLKTGRNDIKKTFFSVTLPVTLQGFAWGGAMATIAAIMGRLGSDVVAANSVALVIQHIATVASFGLAEAGAILLGGNLGQGNLTAAKKNANSLIIVAVISGICGCILMLLCEGAVTSLLQLTPKALGYLHVMYKILSVNVIFAAITYTMLCGVFPSGGDTKYGFYLDATVMWGFCVLLGSIAAFALKLDPIWVFVIINLDELIKTPFVLVRYAQNKWLNTITH